MKTNENHINSCPDCGGTIDAYKVDISFCECCGAKRERYNIEDTDKLNAETNSAGIVLSFLGILAGFIFAIFLLLFQPQITGITKILTYVSLMVSIAVLLLLCFFVIFTVSNLKHGHVRSPNWLADVIHVLYVPGALILTTLFLVSWQLHWGYAVVCLVSVASMFAFIRYKLSYEESIQQYISRITKQHTVDKQHIELIEQWMTVLIEKKIVDSKEIEKLTERLNNLKQRASAQSDPG